MDEPGSASRGQLLIALSWWSILAFPAGFAAGLALRRPWMILSGPWGILVFLTAPLSVAALLTLARWLGRRWTTRADLVWGFFLGLAVPLLWYSWDIIQELLFSGPLC